MAQPSRGAMKAGKPYEAAGPRVLTPFLAATGLLCVAIAVILARWNWIEFVERGIQAANGEISTETRAWLGSLTVSGILLALAAVLVAAGAVVHLKRHALADLAIHTTAQGDPDSVSRAAWRRWTIALAGIAVVIAYPLTLFHGYFRYDDFDLLSIAATRPLLDVLFLPHGDHFLPLTRVLAHVLYQIFGVTAWPYNALILLCMAGVLYAGCRILAELGATRRSQVLFIAVIIFWNPWAELMTGYYILSTYLLIALLSLTAYLAFLRWQKSRKLIHVGAFSLSCLVAPLVDVSGGYVLGAGVVFMFSDWLASRRQITGTAWLKNQWKPLAGLTTAGLLAVGTTVYAYMVAHPGVFLGMAEDGGRSIGRLAGDLVYVLTSGVLVSMITPFVYARLPFVVLTALGVVALGLWLTFHLWAFKAGDSHRRRAMKIMFLIVLGTCLMIALGRPSGDSWVVRWAAKHVCPTYIWVCLLLAAGWDALWSAGKARLRMLIMETTAVGMLGFIALQSAFGLLGMAVAFPPFGYPAEIRDAIRRRDAVRTLETTIINELAQSGPRPVVVPVLDGEYIKRIHPSLFSYNFSNYLPFFEDWSNKVEFVRHASMQRHHAEAVRTVPRLRDAVSASVLRTLAENPDLRRYYFAEVPLTARTLLPSENGLPPLNDSAASPKAAPARTDHVTQTISHGDEFVVRRQSWDPEVAPILRIAMTSAEASGPTEVQLRVIFNGDAFPSTWSGTFSLPLGGGLTEIDLRQVYAFSLSQEVSNLRIQVLTPGRYRLEHLEISL